MSNNEKFEACPNCGNTHPIFGNDSDLNIFRCSCGKIYCDKCSAGGLINLPRCPVSPYHEGMVKIGIVQKRSANEEITKDVRDALSAMPISVPEGAGNAQKVVSIDGTIDKEDAELLQQYKRAGCLFPLKVSLIGLIIGVAFGYYAAQQMEVDPEYRGVHRLQVYLYLDSLPG